MSARPGGTAGLAPAAAGGRRPCGFLILDGVHLLLFVVPPKDRFARGVIYDFVMVFRYLAELTVEVLGVLDLPDDGLAVLPADSLTDGSGGVLFTTLERPDEIRVDIGAHGVVLVFAGLVQLHHNGAVSHSPHAGFPFRPGGPVLVCRVTPSSVPLPAPGSYGPPGGL